MAMRWARAARSRSSPTRRSSYECSVRRSLHQRLGRPNSAVVVRCSPAPMLVPPRTSRRAARASASSKPATGPPLLLVHDALAGREMFLATIARLSPDVPRGRARPAGLRREREARSAALRLRLGRVRRLALRSRRGARPRPRPRLRSRDGRRGRALARGAAPRARAQAGARRRARLPGRRARPRAGRPRARRRRRCSGAS